MCSVVRVPQNFGTQRHQSRPTCNTWTIQVSLGHAVQGTMRSQPFWSWIWEFEGYREESQIRKKYRFAGPEVFLRFDADLYSLRPRFSEIKVQNKRPNSKPNQLYWKFLEEKYSPNHQQPFDLWLISIPSLVSQEIILHQVNSVSEFLLWCVQNS